VGEAAVIVNGKFAQFGGRMLVQVSDMILAQFAANFSLAAAAVPVVAEAPVEAAPQVLAAPEEPAPEPVPGTAPAEPAAAPVLAITQPQPQPKTDLNGLAIAWMLIKSWFGGLFGKRS
jgi:hypothetical protein